MELTFSKIGTHAMTLYETNPFQVLYVTDSPDPRVFVELFSDFLIVHAAPLFQVGNVVLRGTQGSGKSMLLNLLNPAIRLGYASGGQPFPVPNDMARFLGAGINLSVSGALNMGQRPIVSTRADEEILFPLYFADFINYYVVRDMLRSVSVMAKNPQAFDSLVDGNPMDDFAKAVAEDTCWFGFLDEVNSFDDLVESVNKRIAAYRAFHQFNSDLLPQIESTKTTIGEPIARTADWLRKTGVLSEDTPVFVQIDQIERLYRSDVLRPSLGIAYRRVINKALSSRDSRVSYRIGTRPYAWEDDLTIHGTDDRLEANRDYRLIDLDETLRRKEDRSTWIFPKFARDAFARRMRYAGFEGEPEEGKPIDYLASVFGSKPSPSDAARGYAGKSSAQRVLKMDSKWPSEWKTFLTHLFAEDCLTAMLAAAWARQRGQTGKQGDRLRKPPPIKEKPWNKATWKEDRIRQALLQIAARCAQRLKWCGKDSVLALSSGNISIFLSVCYEVWDAFLRAERLKPAEKRISPIIDGIPEGVQAVGIQTASRHWFEKISERSKGHDRKRFVQVLGDKCRTWLRDDDAMSYPGENGFSLTHEELEASPDVKKFLAEAVDHGDLYDAPHTTKASKRTPRTKWYLAPIFSPMFQIPEAHKKEPHYASMREVKEWLNEAGIVTPSPQLTFPFENTVDS